MIPQLSSLANTPGGLRDRYDFDCTRCGATQSLAPSINMLAGINSACVMCNRCNVMLHVEINPDLDGETAKAVLQTVHIAKLRRLEKAVQDGGY